MQVTSFVVADGLYGIPVLLVEEIFRPVGVTPVPLSDPRIEGLLNIRGKSATVLNLRRCLSKPDPQESIRTKMIMLDTDEELTVEARELGIVAFEEPVVLLVDKVHKIFTISSRELLPPPAHITDKFVEGIIRMDDSYLTMLSIPKLIADILSKGS